MIADTKREIWGYLVWGLVAVVIVIPELTAAFAAKKVPWPTISGMTGHLESRWSWVALIVVATIVTVAFHAVRYPWAKTGRIDAGVAQRARARTPGGRLTRRPRADPNLAHTSEAPRDWSITWFAASVVLVAGGSWLVQQIRPHGRFLLGYVLYGSIALFFILVPSLWAFLAGKDVPFPTLFRTIAYLEARRPVVSVLVLSGLVILLLHLALYPWPGIFHVLQPTVHSL